MTAPLSIPPADARRIWLHAQRLDTRAPFGAGVAATTRAVEHLGYVQIDTIFVVERSHHHILFTRIPGYQRADLARAQAVDRTVFEYWTHALAYVPTRDLRFFLAAMKTARSEPSRWFGTVTPADMRKVLRRIRTSGPITIRDIDDDVLVEKHHAWASKKPSKRALQHGFFAGMFAVQSRQGMVKSYELIERHFGWTRRPRAATAREVDAYVLDRALRAQGMVSIDSVCHLDAPRKPAIRSLVEARVKRKELVPVTIAGRDAIPHWIRPEDLQPPASEPLVHILSPFDPLAIQRKRTHLFFDYEHRFEAYVPKPKRLFGYFALPVLVDDAFVAVLDLKTDREARKLLVQKWSWLPVARGRARELRARIEDELARFEHFQLAAASGPTFGQVELDTDGPKR